MEKFQKPAYRWLIKEDMDDVFRIEKSIYKFPFSLKEFAYYRADRNSICMIATKGMETIGYFIYEIIKGKLTIKNLTVNSKYWRQGYGRDFIKYLKEECVKRSKQFAPQIEVHVRESDLSAQLFFKKMGFSCIKIEKNHFADESCDSGHIEDFIENSYCFQYLEVLKSPNTKKKEKAL